MAGYRVDCRNLFFEDISDRSCPPHRNSDTGKTLHHKESRTLTSDPAGRTPNAYKCLPLERWRFQHSGCFRRLSQISEGRLGDQSESYLAWPHLLSDNLVDGRMIWLNALHQISDVGTTPHRHTLRQLDGLRKSPRFDTRPP